MDISHQKKVNSHSERGKRLTNDSFLLTFSYCMIRSLANFNRSCFFPAF